MPRSKKPFKKIPTYFFVVRYREVNNVTADPVPEQSITLDTNAKPGHKLERLLRKSLTLFNVLAYIEI